MSIPNQKEAGLIKYAVLTMGPEPEGWQYCLISSYLWYKWIYIDFQCRVAAPVASITFSLNAPSGKLFATPVILANVFGPNWDNPQFFSRFIAKLQDINSHQLVLGGDFNCVLDRSRVGTRINISKFEEVHLSFLSDYGLLDPWRGSNPDNQAVLFLLPSTQVLFKNWLFSCWWQVSLFSHSIII